MKIRIFSALFLVLLTLAGCTATVRGSVSDPAASGDAAVTSEEAQTQTQEQTQAQTQEQTTADLISKEQAIAIALEHAGFTEDQVRELRAEYDVDHGVKLYEVDFKNENWEYEYDIHAETGEILVWDKEYND